MTGVRGTVSAVFWLGHWRGSMPTRRATRKITLVLIGSAASLTACGPSSTPTYQRDHYVSVEDCAADWGKPEACEPAQGNPLTGSADSSVSGGTSGNSYFYRGPIYSTGYRNDAQSAWRETARAEGRPVSGLAPSDRSVARSGPARDSSSRVGRATARSGFGSSSRSFSSGG